MEIEEVKENFVGKSLDEVIESISMYIDSIRVGDPRDSEPTPEVSNVLLGDYKEVKEGVEVTVRFTCSCEEAEEPSKEDLEIGEAWEKAYEDKTLEEEKARAKLILDLLNGKTIKGDVFVYGYSTGMPDMLSALAKINPLHPRLKAEKESKQT